MGVAVATPQLCHTTKQPQHTIHGNSTTAHQPRNTNDDSMMTAHQPRNTNDSSSMAAVSTVSGVKTDLGPQHMIDSVARTRCEKGARDLLERVKPDVAVSIGSGGKAPHDF